MSEKQNVLKEFAAKARLRLQDKRQEKRLQLFVPSLEQNITIRNLQKNEVAECLELNGTDDDADEYAVYLACVEPNLKELAEDLKKDGEIRKYTDVVEIFEYHEIREISKEVMKLSGVLGNKKVVVADDLKN